MAWEIHTFGGGIYLEQLLNGIAALVGSRSYINLIALSGSMALFWSLIQSAFTNQFKNTATWAVSMMLAYNVLFLPRVAVVINDPLNRGAVYREVRNVPAALGIFASLSSQVGYKLTQIIETAFSMPDDLKYHQSGMLFGSRLLNITMAAKITNSNFAASVNSYMKQCVFYDILLGRYTLEELKTAPNLWVFLKEKPSKARSFEITTNTGRIIRTCAEGIKDLEPYWTGETSHSINLLSGVLTPVNKLLDPADERSRLARDLFIRSIPQAQNEFLQLSRNATETLRQSMLINAIDHAAADFSNTGSSANIYTSVRSNIQTKAAFNASRKQAEEWLPIFKNVLEVLFYGSFPLVFLMFLMPIGGQVIQNYFFGFVWLQAWAPLYAILNFVMTTYASGQTMAISGGNGITIASYAGIEEVNRNISQMAGYISWFIPFIAAGLAKGMVSATSGLATSVLSVPQSAANAAASEVATGNISLGNFSMGNASYGTISSNKINDSLFFDGGRAQVNNLSGGLTTVNPDGRVVHDQTGSVSRVPNLQITSNETLASSLSQVASTYQNMGENLAMQASSSKARSIDTISQHMASHSINENHGVKYADHASADVRESYNRLNQAANEFARDEKIDKVTALNMMLNGSFGKSMGSAEGGKGNKQPSRGMGVGFSVGGGGSAEAKSSLTYGESERTSQTQQLQKDVSTVLNAISDRSLEFSDSRGNSLNTSITEGLSESKRLEDQSRTYFDLSRNLSEQSQLVRSESLSFNQDRIPEFIEYAKSARKLNGELLGEQALQAIASDPQTAKTLWQGFQQQSGHSSGIIKNHHSSAAYKETQSLNQAYTDKSKKIANDIMPQLQNSGVAEKAFSTATQGKGIDNSNLKDSISNRIDNNRDFIGSVKVDHAGVRKEVQKELDDGLLIAPIKAISVTSDPSKKSNFNNNDNE